MSARTTVRAINFSGIAGGRQLLVEWVRRQASVWCQARARFSDASRVTIVGAAVHQVGLLREDTETVGEPGGDPELAMADIVQLDPVHRPKLGEPGRTSTATSQNRPRATRISFPAAARAHSANRAVRPDGIAAGALHEAGIDPGLPQPSLAAGLTKNPRSSADGGDQDRTPGSSVLTSSKSNIPCVLETWTLVVGEGKSTLGDRRGMLEDFGSWLISLRTDGEPAMEERSGSVDDGALDRLWKPGASA